MYKGGKYCSLQAYGSHQPRDELWGQAISCLTDECSEAQEENDPGAKKTQTTNTYSVAARRAVQARCIDVFNCCSEARAGSCEVLARNFHWYPLVLPELSAGFHFDSRGDTRETWGIQPGQSRELAHKVPTLQTEIIFFSSLSIKSVMWGLFFFLSCNCISCYKQTSGWSDSTR